MTGIFFLLFLLSCAWQDITSKTVSGWLYLLFAPAALAVGAVPPVDWYDMAWSFMLGVGLLLLSGITRGAIGVGDGWFFIVSALYISSGENLLLLLSGIFLCGLYSLSLLVWGSLKQIRTGKRNIPFLPFLVPVGVWMVVK